MKPLKNILFTKEDIAERITELGKTLTIRFLGKPRVHVVVILKGGFVFAADLVRAMEVPVIMCFVSASSYHGSKTRGKLLVDSRGLPSSLAGETVLLIDDILDSGETMVGVLAELGLRGCTDVVTCTVINKLVDADRPIVVNYSAFDIQPQFVVGYGLDYEELYRDLPYIGVLAP